MGISWGYLHTTAVPLSFNPVELANAYLKRWIRKWAPEEGYTQVSLEAAIHRASAKITPTFVDHWIQGCGYGQGAHEDHERAQNVVPQRPSRVPQGNNTQPLARHQVRWAGYNPAEPPAGVAETEPPEVILLGGDVFEPERIVEERMSTSGKREFRIRWKDFGPRDDTWEPDLRDWKIRRSRR